MFIVTSNPIIVYKLLVLDQNIGKHTTMYTLFVLDKKISHNVNVS